MEGMYKNKEKDSKRFLIILLIVIVTLALIVIGILVGSLLIGKKEEKPPKITTTTKVNKIESEFKSTEILGTLTGGDSSELIDLLDDDNNIRIYYPQMTGEGKDLDSFNKMIKNRVESIKNDYNDSINPADTACFTIRPVGEVAPRVYEFFIYYRYAIIENKNNFIINEYEIGATSCATGNTSLMYTYDIDKSTGTVKTIKEYGSYGLTTDYAYYGISTSGISEASITFIENNEMMLISSGANGNVENTKGKYKIDGNTLTYTREYININDEWVAFDINATEYIKSVNEVFTLKSDFNIQGSNTSYYSNILFKSHN